jgi:phenylacetate-CoA ligase
VTTLSAPSPSRDLAVRLRAALDMRIDLAGDVDAVMSLDRDALDRWVSHAVGDTVRHACTSSPFYAERVSLEMAAAAADGRPGAFEALPFTTRESLSVAYPFGLLAVPRADVIRFDESSGTSTGQSIAALFTAEDWLVNNLTVARLLSPVVHHDVVAIAVPYELAGVGQDLDRAFEILGCPVVPLGAASPTCSPERMVEALLDSAATTLVCSGTRALYLGEIARRMGIDPLRGLAVDKILMAGEGASPAKRRRLKDLWGAHTYSMFGMTETNTLAMFCTRGELHLVETRTFFEIVDPSSGNRLPDGATGELAVTTLASRAMPLLRYRTGDTCQIEPARCACGSVLRRLRHRGRIADRISIGQHSASQLEIEDIVLSSATAPPHYFTFGVGTDGLEVALPGPSLENLDVTGAIAAEVSHRFGVPTRFRELDIEQFELGLKMSSKPTMQTFRPVRGSEDQR